MTPSSWDVCSLTPTYRGVGSFDWGSDSFDETAKYISFHHDEVILSAFLKDWDKVYQPAQVCLNDRIENDNGVLRIDRGFFGGLVADIWNLGNILIQIEKGERNVSNNIREWLEKAKYNADGIVHPP